MVTELRSRYRCKFRKLKYYTKLKIIKINILITILGMKPAPGKTLPIGLKVCNIFVGVYQRCIIFVILIAYLIVF